MFHRLHAGFPNAALMRRSRSDEFPGDTHVRHFAGGSAIAPFFKDSLNLVVGSHERGAVVRPYFAAHTPSAGEPDESVQEMLNGHAFHDVQMDRASDEADEDDNPTLDGCWFAVCAGWFSGFSELHRG